MLSFQTTSSLCLSKNGQNARSIAKITHRVVSCHPAVHSNRIMSSYFSRYSKATSNDNQGLEEQSYLLQEQDIYFLCFPDAQEIETELPACDLYKQTLNLKINLTLPNKYKL